MSSGFETLEGWHSFHDFREIDWARWRAIGQREQDSMLEELMMLVNQWRQVDLNREGSFGLFDVAGAKGDFLFFNLRPTIDALMDAKHALNQTRFAQFLRVTTNFTSMVEMSNYVVSSERRPQHDAFVQSRLYPNLPAVKYLCFYPMNKRRMGEDNWYSLPVEQRQQLMRAHGETGMKFKGQVTQMICGAIGLDDFEWGVTLFADDPLVFKKVVTEMRFDEVSARYADFGAFYIGRKMDNDSFLKLVRPN